MREERIVVGGRELVLARPDDPGEPDRRGAASRRTSSCPTGPSCGRAGSRSRDYVADARPRRPRVLELGCGLALPSFAAALVGADVLATDWAPEALDARRRERRGERPAGRDRAPRLARAAAARSRAVRCRSGRGRPVRGAKRRAAPRPARRDRVRSGHGPRRRSGPPPRGRLLRAAPPAAAGRSTTFRHPSSRREASRSSAGPCPPEAPRLCVDSTQAFATRRLAARGRRCVDSTLTPCGAGVRRCG